jgi:hypothetical protein
MSPLTPLSTAPKTAPSFGKLARLAKHTTLAKVATLAGIVALALTPACGEDEVVYTPKPAVSGKVPSLPAVPTLPQKQKKVGDAYTIWGATHDLRSRVHIEDVLNKKISLVGYIVKTNYQTECSNPNGVDPGTSKQQTDCAAKCAIHKTGKADPAECKAEVPRFYIADEKGETKDMIAVMGWASNFAQMYNLIEEIDKAPKGKEGEVKVSDVFYGVDMPNPVPNVGAKVKVTGTYSVTFTKATSGAAANPKYGIMTSDTIEYLEPPPEKGYLPGMKKKP